MTERTCANCVNFRPAVGDVADGVSQSLRLSPDAERDIRRRFATTAEDLKRRLDKAAEDAFAAAAETHSRPGGALNRGRAV